MPGPKMNNIRRYPHANRQPRHKAAERIGRAQARQEERDGLTLEQKIALLPPEPYAKKQRARYMSQLEKRNQPKKVDEKPSTLNALQKGDLQFVAGESSPKKETQTKKYMKGSK